MNPFNYVAQGLFLVYEVYKAIMMTILRVWSIVGSALVAWILIAIFLPGISFFEHVEWLLTVVVVNPALFLFESFSGIAEYILVNYVQVEENPVKLALSLLGWLGFVGLSLIIMPAIYFGWVVFSYMGFANLLSGKTKAQFMSMTAGGSVSGSMENLSHIFRGHTTVQKVYDADVQANSIADAIKNK